MEEGKGMQNEREGIPAKSSSLSSLFAKTATVFLHYFIILLLPSEADHVTCEEGQRSSPLTITKGAELQQLIGVKTEKKERYKQKS